MHIRFDCLAAENGHPQEVMRSLGIAYQHATPQSMAEQWWFWNCQGLPEKLPDYLSELRLSPEECIGYGLTEQVAADIRNNMAKEA